jgi:hypothetical protein
MPALDNGGPNRSSNRKSRTNNHDDSTASGHHDIDKGNGTAIQVNKPLSKVSDRIGSYLMRNPDQEPGQGPGKSIISLPHQ